MRLPADALGARFATLAALTLALSACGGGSSHVESIAAMPANGPQADYPVVVGAPYSVAGA